LNKEKYFETIKCNNQEVYNLDYHNKRIASTIGINIQLQEYIYPSSNEYMKCKIVYDESGILEISYTPYIKKPINSFKIVYDNDINYSKKTLDRKKIDNLYNQKENADEIIIVKNNLITDTSIANIAIFYENRWLTPKTPLLLGTTRKRYLDNGRLEEKEISVEMLHKANKIALLNAMIDFDIKTNFDII
jgi:4-amino-4-deoxychorismate lyase